MQRAVLVTGGGGFIGSHLCQSLLDDNYVVFCVDNFITGDKNNLKNLLNNPQFVLLEHDIMRPIQQNQNLDYIFHLASPASPNKKSPRSYINYPIETLLANSVGTYHLLELSLKYGAKFLFASSSEIYGDPAISPQKEDYFGNVNPNGIRSCYDEGKRFGEAITFSYIRKYNLDARVIRIFNTYGPLMRADDGRVVSNFINQAINSKPITVYGKGTQTRSLCFVDDMVLGIKLAMFSPNTKAEVFNLGNPDERTILNIAKLIKNMTKSSSEIVFEDLPIDDPKGRKPDISKAKRILGWEPKITTIDGLKKTINYFKSL
ncbi:MAG: NAD-dependent epimerase/dehydratase family protein [Candidatus Levybacteria bacterium]|nr:NAD-dependent epimerase/dehydratase family protein [Candidatus Levybacteria bacterium]